MEKCCVTSHRHYRPSSLSWLDRYKHTQNTNTLTQNNHYSISQQDFCLFTKYFPANPAITDDFLQAIKWESMYFTSVKCHVLRACVCVCVLCVFVSVFFRRNSTNFVILFASLRVAHTLHGTKVGRRWKWTQSRTRKKKMHAKSKQTCNAITRQQGNSTCGTPATSTNQSTTGQRESWYNPFWLNW